MFLSVAFLREDTAGQPEGGASHGDAGATRLGVAGNEKVALVLAHDTLAIATHAEVHILAGPHPGSIFLFAGCNEVLPFLPVNLS